MATSKTAGKSLDEIVNSRADDELAQLEEDLANAPETEDFADAFRFEEPGDQVVGRVVGVSSNTNQYGEYPILTVQVKGGDLVAVHGLGTILKRELLKASEGSLVAVRYQGEKRSDKSGSTYKDYKVIVRKG